MTADDIVVFLFDGEFGGDEFKVVDLSDRLIDAGHNPFGDRYAFPAKGFQDKVYKSVEADQEVIAAAPQFGEYLCAAFRRVIEYVAVEDPGHFVVDLQHQLVGQGEIAHLDVGIAPHHFVVVAGDVENPGA